MHIELSIHGHGHYVVALAAVDGVEYRYERLSSLDEDITVEGWEPSRPNAEIRDAVRLALTAAYTDNVLFHHSSSLVNRKQVEAEQANLHQRCAIANITYDYWFVATPPQHLTGEE